MYSMKKFLSLLILICFVFTHHAGNEIKLISESANKTSLKLEFDDHELKPVGEIDGVEHFIVTAEDAVPNLNLNNPDIPKITAAIQLPNKGVSSINVVSSSFTDYLNVEIAPSKGNLYRNIDPASIDFVKGASYNNNEFYPGNLVQLSDPFLFRTIRGQVVEFFPVQYNPVTKILRIYNEINVEVVNDLKEIGINELEETNVLLNTIHDINKNRFINYSAPKYDPVAEEGTMLVICKDELIENMNEFINWKKRKGISVEIVPISEVGNSQSSIFSYVSNYYQNNPDFVYLLLVGDHADVNCYNMGSTGGWMPEIKWSDSKYGLLSGNDWYPDVFVGRFSASTSQNLQKILDRNMEYEITPSSGDWYTKAIGLGSDEGQGYGDDGEADWYHLRNIRTDLLNFGFSEVFEFYDGSQGGADAPGSPNSNDIRTAVNNGVSLFNYTGHGDQNVCVTGNFSTSHINSCTNEGKYPFVISVACNNGTFTTGSCISEAWMLATGANGTTGAIAACGSSILMSWAPPMATQDEIVDILVESYQDNKKYTLGGLFYNGQMQMLDDYPGSQGNEVIETWVFFGDPSVMMRTQDPLDLSASHVTELIKGSSELTISNCNVEGALICLTQNNNILGTGIVNNGMTTISFASLDSLDDVVVTGTAYNTRPYQGNVKVVEENISAETTLSLFPNPVESNGVLTLNFDLNEDSDMDFKIINSLGQIVREFSINGLLAGSHSYDLDINGFRSGIYEIFTVVGDSDVIAKFLVR